MVVICKHTLVWNAGHYIFPESHVFAPEVSAYQMAWSQCQAVGTKE
jgi:hypothetical protein